MFKPKYSLPIAIAWLLLVIFLMCTPGTKFPKIGWQDKIMLDKWIHVFIFMMLTIAWCRAYFHKKVNIDIKKTFIAITLLSLVFGVVMEIVQERYIPFRFFDWGDIAADSIGTILGYFISDKRYKKINPA